jgi:DNA-binding beta-propeller fold protein YncE
VLDTDNHRVQVFDPNGAYKSQFNPGFDLPPGMTMDTSGKLYVKDGNLNCQVDKFDANGNFLLQFGVCSTAGLGPGIFDNTGGIAIDPAGNVWVTSPDFYYMQKFDSGGHYLSMVCMANVNVFGCPVTTPFSVQPLGVAFDTGGNIYVTNVDPFTGYNIVKFNGSGAYLSSFGTTGSGNAQFNDPYGIALDASGNIFVADTLNNRVQKFTSTGVYVSQFGGKGSGNGQFLSPVGLAFDTSGNIYVTDVGNNRVQKFDKNGNYLSQFGTAGAGNGQFNAPFAVVIK